MDAEIPTAAHVRSPLIDTAGRGQARDHIWSSDVWSCRCVEGRLEERQKNALMRQVATRANNVSCGLARGRGVGFTERTWPDDPPTGRTETSAEEGRGAGGREEKGAGDGAGRQAL